MRQKNFTLLLLLLALLCSTLPAGALRVKTENVAPGSKLDFNRVPGNRDISVFSTGIPYFAHPDPKNYGASFNTRVENIEFIGGRKTITAYRDMPDWVISYLFRPTITKGYINGSKEKKPLPNYAQITQVNVPVMNAGGAGDKNTMNVKTYVRTLLMNSEDATGRIIVHPDLLVFFDNDIDNMLALMGRMGKDTYVSTADYEKYSEFNTLSWDIDSAYWSRPVDEHPEDFIHTNFPNPYTWTYDYNNFGFFFMFDIRDAHDVHLLLPIRDEEKFDESDKSYRGMFNLDRVSYAGKGKGMFNDTIHEPLFAHVLYTDDINEEGESIPDTCYKIYSTEPYNYITTVYQDIPEFHFHNDYWNDHSVNGGAWSFVMKYYTNDLRGKVLNNDSTSITDQVTEDQPSGRPLVRLYDVTVQRYITPEGKTLNAHGSFEVEEDGSFEFPALNPSHRYQLSFASYSYGYYEINEIFFDPDKESHGEQPTSTAPRAVIPFSFGMDKCFDQREPGKLYDLEMTLLLNKNDVTTGVANPGTGREVSRVRYFNMQGCESSQPHSGVNVVVTEYSDGGKSTAKKVIP